MRNLFYLILISFIALSVKAQVAPTATIVKTSTLNCTKTAIHFSLSSTANIVSYTWAVQPTKDVIAQSDLNSDKISVTFSSTANHTISVSFTDDQGNTGSALSPLTLYQTPNATFNASFNSTGVPTDLILTNYSTNYTKNYWHFNDNLGDSSINTTKSYTTAGSYSVKLYTYGNKGCTDSSSYDFVLKINSDLTLPNIFTPNGDGANDIYRPVSNNISSLKAFVYNRYGVLITSWTTVNGFWDGHTISGEESPDGVYFIVVEATGSDGQDYKLNSTITLIR